MFTQLGVIGCGLMGGSFAAAMKRAGLVKRIVGYSKSPSTTERAKKLGIIDVAAESALLAVSGSDIVLIAVPVAATETTFKAIRHLVEPGVLFMDVGSTKRDVVDAARRVLRERVAFTEHRGPRVEADGEGLEDAEEEQGARAAEPRDAPAADQRADEASGEARGAEDLAHVVEPHAEVGHKRAQHALAERVAELVQHERGDPCMLAGQRHPCANWLRA
jgi:prephenate dehydrogenase